MPLIMHRNNKQKEQAFILVVEVVTRAVDDRYSSL